MSVVMTYELTGSSESAIIIVLLSLLAVTFVGAVCLHSCNRRRSRHIKSFHGNCIDSTGEDGAYTEVAAVEMNGDIANGRLLSHDRALPEIPASASGVASTDDDDEEDEGHYDVISKNRRAAAAAAGVSSNSRTQKPRFCHPYETVAGDSDSTYAGIREELEAAISLRNSRLRANDSSTAAVVAAGSSSDRPYAGIMGDSNNDAQTSAPGVSLRPRIPSTYSVTVSNPQQQRSHGSEHVGETDRTLSVGVRADNDAESPLLPPRNGTIDGVDGGPSSVATCSVSNTWTHLTAAVSTLSTGAVNSSPNVTTTSASAAANDDPIAHVQDQLQLLHVGASGDAMPVSDVPSMPVVTERVANYSSVTARESLENLRRRQQQDRRRCPGLLMSDDIDATYDTIDYDLVNSFPVGNCTSTRVAASDNSVMYNNGSDLYAEIGTGPSSAQSSTTYAKVSDLTIDQNTAMAPLAPPVDALMHLNTEDDAAAADSYSVVDEMTSSVSSAMHVTNPSAVYAVVSRNRTTPSQTDPVQVSSGISSSAAAAGIDAADAVTVDARRDLYTRVIRRQDAQHPPASSSRRVTSEPSRVDVSADGYASIDEPLAAPQQPKDQHYNNGIDFYDVIRDDLSVTASSDFDPNYESVPQTMAASVSTSAADSVNCVVGSGSSTAGQRQQQDAGVTVLVVSDADTSRQNEPATRHRSFLVREHIYDEVSSPPARCSTTNKQTDV